MIKIGEHLYCWFHKKCLKDWNEMYEKCSDLRKRLGTKIALLAEYEEEVAKECKGHQKQIDNLRAINKKLREKKDKL